MPKRATRGQGAEREVSRGRNSRSRGGEGPNGRESETTGDLEGTRPQMTRQLELPFWTEGEARQSERSGEVSTAAPGTERSGASGLMERVLARPNMQAALKRVRKNKGSPGIDGMTVDELPDWLREHWVRVREELLAGTFRPQPVKRNRPRHNGRHLRSCAGLDGSGGSLALHQR